MLTLKQLRASKGISQSELAEAFGVSPGTIYNVEKNSENIKDSLLNKYLVAFGVSYDDIFLGNDYEIYVFEKEAKEKVLK